MKVRFSSYCECSLVCLWGSNVWTGGLGSLTSHMYIPTRNKQNWPNQPSSSPFFLPPSPRDPGIHEVPTQIFVRQPCFHRASINISALSFLFFLCCLLFPRSSFLTLRPLSLFLSLAPCLLSLYNFSTLCVIWVCWVVWIVGCRCLCWCCVEVMWCVRACSPLVSCVGGWSGGVVLARVPCARSRRPRGCLQDTRVFRTRGRFELHVDT